MIYPQRTQYSKTKVFMNECIGIINKIENQGHLVDYIDAFRLISVYVELGGDTKWSRLPIEDQLIKMYAELKKFIKKESF